MSSKTETNNETIVVESLIANKEKSGSNDQQEETTNLRIASDSGRHGCFLNFYLKYRGVCFGLFSAFSMALSSVLIKRVRIFTPSDITLTRYLIQFISMIIIIRRKSLPMFGPSGQLSQRISLIMRGAIGVVGLTAMHFAVKFVDPSDSQSLFNSSILFTAIFARIFLKEKLNIGHIVSILMTISGVILISQPKFLFKHFHAEKKYDMRNTSLIFNFNQTANQIDLAQQEEERANTNRLIGIGLSLIGAGAAAIVPVIIKHLSNKSVHYSVMIIYASYFGIPVSIIISVILFIFKDTMEERKKLVKSNYDVPIDLSFMLIASLLGLISQIGWNLAIKYEDASRASVIRSLNIFFVFFLQYLFLDIKSNIFSIVGAIAILFGTLFIIAFKILDNKYSIKQKKPETSPKANEFTESNEADKTETEKRHLFRKIIFYKV